MDTSLVVMLLEVLWCWIWVVAIDATYLVCGWRKYDSILGRAGPNINIEVDRLFVAGPVVFCLEGVRAKCTGENAI